MDSTHGLECLSWSLSLISQGPHVRTTGEPGLGERVTTAAIRFVILVAQATVRRSSLETFASLMKLPLFLLLLATIIVPVSLRSAEEATGKFVLTCLEIPDVQRGAGLAIILQLPSGKTCLYDTGSGYPDATSPDGWQGEFNAGRDLILPFLTKAGIKEIETVFISHAHYDHFGGLLWLDDHFPIKKLVDSGYHFVGEAPDNYVTELDDYTKLREKFKKRGAYQGAHTGDLLNLDEQFDTEVTAPPKEFFTKAFPELRSPTDPPAHYLVNANSLGLRIQFGKTVFLLPGDIQAEDQVRALLPSVPHEKLKCDVLIAPGHGIHAPLQFAAVTRPEVTLCSVFPRYARGLAARKTYAGIGSQVFVTGLHGMIQVVADGKTYQVTTERDDTLLQTPKK
jgi:competence protein ComEC